ncbi:SWIM zinc finger family protein [Streptomyces luteogriseus]|uniref:SWIM zinc finger family protein n=1 Tax=Streptomyces luteogriseus TaxID=68233 RepID=UPI0036E8A548
MTPRQDRAPAPGDDATSARPADEARRALREARERAAQDAARTEPSPAGGAAAQEEAPGPADAAREALRRAVSGRREDDACEVAGSSPSEGGGERHDTTATGAGSEPEDAGTPRVADARADTPAAVNPEPRESGVPWTSPEETTPAGAAPARSADRPGTGPRAADIAREALRAARDDARRAREETEREGARRRRRARQRAVDDRAAAARRAAADASGRGAHDLGQLLSDAFRMPDLSDATPDDHERTTGQESRPARTADLLHGLAAAGSDVSGGGQDLGAAGSEASGSGHGLSAPGSEASGGGHDSAASGSEVPDTGHDVAAAGSEMPDRGRGLTASGLDASGGGRGLGASGSGAPDHGRDLAAANSEAPDTWRDLAVPSPDASGSGHDLAVPSPDVPDTGRDLAASSPETPRSAGSPEARPEASAAPTTGTSDPAPRDPAPIPHGNGRADQDLVPTPHHDAPHHDAPHHDAPRTDTPPTADTPPSDAPTRPAPASVATPPPSHTRPRHSAPTSSASLDPTPPPTSASHAPRSARSPRSMAAPSRDNELRRTFPPLPPRDGDRFAESWWGNAWVEALERGALDVKRLERGRGYAGQGHVDAITVTPGLVLAYVQGSRPRPYRVQVRLRTLDDTDWDRFLDTAADRPGHIAALLDKEMPQSLAECGVPLLPGPGDLEPRCSCPDRGHPCKHAAALCYQTARLLDADPFVLLLLRGRGERELLDALSRLSATRAARAAQDRGPAPLPGVRAAEVLASRALPPLPAPLPPPAHPEQPPAYPAAPGGPDPFALDQLATDAAARAHALLGTGRDPVGQLTFWQDAVRLAAARPGAGLTAGTRALYSSLAAAAGRTPSELARAVAAWRQGGPEGLAVLEEPWDPPAGRFDRARPLLLAADLPAFRPWRNHLTHPRGHLQLRLGRDGLWYAYESEPGHDDWWPRGTPDLDPVGALTGLGLPSDF